ncbi:MAG: prepilin-type N-terminal cleavage/methylation domain-containing protein [Nitrospirae bacterium]|nr:prepilin-type N-terminal cleavage/methylation domain-containing protein [Nitrospirota bacterium]
MNKCVADTADLTGCVMRRCGFTLVEMLVTMVIIGILSAIAIPLYLGQIDKAKRTEAVQNIQALRLIMEQYHNENGCYYMPCSPAPGNQVIVGAANIQAFLPTFSPGNTSGMLFNYRVEINNGGTTYNIGAVLLPGAVSAGAVCAAGELKIDYKNNKCGF